MLCKNCITDIITSRGLTKTEAAKKIGVTQAGLASALSKNNPTLDTLCRYVSPFGYDVALVPAGTKLPPDAYVLESSKPRVEVDLDDPDLMLG